MQLQEIEPSSQRTPRSPLELVANHVHVVARHRLDRRLGAQVDVAVRMLGTVQHAGHDLAGKRLGAFALLLVEEVLKGWTEHWQVILGPLLVLSVIFFKRGLAGIFYKPDA